jgi:hypothetical protein
MYGGVRRFFFAGPSGSGRSRVVEMLIYDMRGICAFWLLVWRFDVDVDVDDVDKCQVPTITSNQQCPMRRSGSSRTDPAPRAAEHGAKITPARTKLAAG